MAWMKSLLVVGLIALPVPALAGSLMANLAFGRLDDNGDGQLDASELKQARAARFERLDTNRDGVLTEAELTAPAGRLQQKAEAAESALSGRFEVMDGDSDGKVSREEFLAATSPDLKARIDGNGDGLISQSEFAAALDKRRAGN